MQLSIVVTLFQSYLLGFPYSNISYVHIRNATLDIFNASEIRWRMLKSLAITDGRIKKVQGQFRMMTPTQCLNLSNNALMEVENNSLIRLAQLTTLDLSYNNLTHLPALNTMNGREFWLDISGINGSMYYYISPLNDTLVLISLSLQEQIHFRAMTYINISIKQAKSKSLLIAKTRQCALPWQHGIGSIPPNVYLLHNCFTSVLYVSIDIYVYMYKM